MALCIALSRKLQWLSYSLPHLKPKQFSTNSWLTEIKFVPTILSSNILQNKVNYRFNSSLGVSVMSTNRDLPLSQNRAPYCSNILRRDNSVGLLQQQHTSLSTLMHVRDPGCITSWSCILTQTRLKHSKGGKGGKGKSVIHLSSEELNSVISEKKLLFELDAVLEDFKEDLVKSVAVRTNIGSLEELPVELEGDTFPLNELAQVHRKSTHLVIIECSAFPQATKNIFEAIRDSGMNLNPQQDGTKIAVPLPKVTREHREGLANKAKVLCNRCKDGLRQVHNTHVRKAKNKEGQVSSDLLFKVTQKIKELLDERTKAAEALLAAEQAELLKV